METGETMDKRGSEKESDERKQEGRAEEGRRFIWPDQGHHFLLGGSPRRSLSRSLKSFKPHCLSGWMAAPLCSFFFFSSFRPL